MVEGLPKLPMIAKRRRSGTTSRKSSSRLDAVSACWSDRPVTLPPGRAREATRPVPTGSPAVANTIGMTDVACFAATVGGVEDVTMTSTFSRTNSAAISANCSVRPSAQRKWVGTTLDPAAFAQLLHKQGHPLAIGRRCGLAQVPDGRQLPRLLRARRERPCRRRAAEQRYELAPP